MVIPGEAMFSRDISYLNELASRKGGKCLSLEYINNHTKYQWECIEGHVWCAVSNNIQQGQWCPDCAGKKKKDLYWLQELAKQSNGKCLSTEYISNKIKYTWQCQEGHIWEAVVGDVQQGQWCPDCAGNRKKDINWLQELASRRGGKCLSTEYINSKTQYLWECKEGHRWTAPANYIRQGCWCSECYGNKRKDIKWLQELASKNNGKCLSIEYVNCTSRYLWQCQEGHIWEANSNSITQGSWCPTCFHKHSKSELEIYEFIKSFHLDAINGKRGLLKSQRLELDIYIPSLNKAIEYDGTYWHNTGGSLERDVRKNLECQEAGISLMRISEEDYINDKEEVKRKVVLFLGT